MAKNEYKGHNGILGSRIIQEKELTAVNSKTGETVGTFKAEPGSNVLKWKEEADTTQLKFDIHDDGVLDITDDDLTVDYMNGNPDYDGTTPIWIYADPVLFDDETKKLFLSLPHSERPRFTIDLVERFYVARPEYNDFARRLIYEDPVLLLDLFKSLTPEDFETLKIGNAELRFDQLQQRIEKAEKAIEKTPIDAAKLSTVWPILSMREMFLESELAAFYYLKNPNKAPKELAKEKGAIMTIGGRLADLSNKDYSGWLDEKFNTTAYLSYVGPHYWDNIEIDEGGNLYDNDEAKVLRAVRNQDAKVKKAFEVGTFGDERPAGHERINKELMRALTKAVIAEKGGTITLYLPAFAKELNENYNVDIDEYNDNGELNEKGEENKAAAEKREKDAAEARKKGEKVYTKEKPSIMQQLYSLDYWAGILDTNYVTRTAVIVGLNKEAKTIDIFMPYISKIIKSQEEAQRLEAETHRRAYILPAYNFLVHTNIESERNKLAVDLVYTIIDKLLRRGSKTASQFKENQTDDGSAEDQTPKAGERVTYRIKYKTLIDDTPLLYMNYKNAKNADQKYKLLTRTFTKAFQLLHKKTDIYKYFVDLKIPETPPTIRTIDNTLVITHRGRNNDYNIIK